nr:MAG TPA: hypothetical protein [Bacteriophage sp.]
MKSGIPRSQKQSILRRFPVWHPDSRQYGGCDAHSVSEGA